MNENLRITLRAPVGAAEGDLVIGGVAMVYGVRIRRAWMRIEFAAGCFGDGGLDDVKLIEAHGGGIPFASVSGDTLSFDDGPERLRWTAALSGAQVRAQDAHDAIARGDLTDVSMGVERREWRWRLDDDDDETMVIELARAPEISFVDHGQIEEAVIDTFARSDGPNVVAVGGFGDDGALAAEFRRRRKERLETAARRNAEMAAEISRIGDALQS